MDMEDRGVDNGDDDEYDKKGGDDDDDEFEESESARFLLCCGGGTDIYVGVHNLFYLYSILWFVKVVAFFRISWFKDLQHIFEMNGFAGPEGLLFFR